MKRFFITAAIVAIFSIAAHAQKYALVDMEYILKNIPQYEMANEQLNQVSLRWQKEVEAKSKEAETLYKNYQSDMVFLTDEQKKKKEEENFLSDFHWSVKKFFLFFLIHPFSYLLSAKAPTRSSAESDTAGCSLSPAICFPGIR